MKKKVVTILLSLCMGYTYAQSGFESKNRNAQQAYQNAGKSITYKLYDKAIEQLKQAVIYDEKFTAAYQQMGDVYRRQQKYAEAVEAYNHVLRLNPDFYPGTYFGLGESEVNTGKYNTALDHLKKYLSYPTVSESGKKQAEKLIADCEFSIPAIQHPVNFNPVNLGEGVNTKDWEYLPVVTADDETLIFTRQTNQNEDFYTSVKRDGKWTKATFLSPNINTSEFNEGAQCISPDGMYLFFTGCNRPDGMGRCDIYISKREGKSWSKPFNIGNPVNSPGWESQPSLSADGKTLYFVSTRPGGYGGYDIWKSTLKPGGGWSDPENLGPNINTAYDEYSPFIHADDQTLYFSSNGWPGFGHKDLFLSRKDSAGNWQKPENLGYPINSYGEESGLFISSDGRTAYFSAEKPDGYGGMDIYSFDLPAALRPKPVTYVKGIVFDKKTGEPLEAAIKIINIADNTLAYDDSSEPGSGEFLATMPIGKKFALNIEKEGYLFYSANYSLDKPSSAIKPFLVKVPLEKIEPGALVVLSNIFFDTNKYNLLPESKAELQQVIHFLQKNPKVVIEISGHTDNVGDMQKNMVLSENRAKAVYNYLLENQIAASRLTYKGYGETKPVAENASEEGRQQNRRTEFRVIKTD
ncbi:OmpA family protein [Pedobacter sp. BS3]|uniref:OmpA family protein n=1 Tax=Pedobacter sp. BS3 TaxID=2567937 RepID=UPI0011EF91F1|nr:OmpA family protein [Pedobacter sp. BS3]TZF81854.1 OmpA family protein [Pedobacter sp. BS3]